MLNISCFDGMPDLLATQDLVSLGLYPSTDAAYLARIRGKSPDFLKIGRKVLYPKASVMDFLKKCLCSGATRFNSSTTEGTRQC